MADSNSPESGQDAAVKPHLALQRRELLGNLLVGLLTGGLALSGVLWSSWMDRKNSEDLAQREFQTNLVLRMLEADTDEEREEGLAFIIETNLLTDERLRDDLLRFIEGDENLPQVSPESNPIPSPSMSMWLSDLESRASSEESLESTEDALMNGTLFLRALEGQVPCDDSEVVASYNLSRNWDTLTFVAGISDDSDFIQNSGQISIVTDGEEIFANELSLGQSIPVSLDVDGALRLEIHLAGADCSDPGDSVTAILGDPQLS